MPFCDEHHQMMTNTIETKNNVKWLIESHKEMVASHKETIVLILKHIEDGEKNFRPKVVSNYRAVGWLYKILTGVIIGVTVLSARIVLGG